MKKRKLPPYTGSTQAERAKNIPSADWQAAMKLRAARMAKGASFSLRDLAVYVFFGTDAEAFDRARVILELMISSELVEKVDGWRAQGIRKGGY